MKNKILPLILIIIFLFIFVIFYYGLRNSNIYVPQNNIKKDIPSFDVKLFNLDTKINSEKIFKDDNLNAKKFLEELGNPYKTILSDTDGLISIELGAYGVPETFLIYKKKIIKKIVGPLNENSLSDIKSLIE